MTTFLYKAQIGDADHYCDGDRAQAMAIFDRYKGDGIPCCVWEQEWSDDPDADEPDDENIIATNRGDA